MKKLYFLVGALLLAGATFAQAPQKMTYQAVVRNSSNNLVVSSPIGMRVSILQGSATGTSVYVETHTATTNSNGLATVKIGGGTVVSGTFSTIDWSTGTYFVKTETDITGGTNYTIAGTSELLSVPYALYAENAGVAGPQGPIGATGPQGPAGNDGLDGATGPMGPQGPAGVDGLDGATGPMGPQGPAGVDGLDGATGPMGPQGPTGLTGPAGPAGPVAGADTQIIFNNAGAAGASANLTWNDATSTLNVTGKTVTNNLNLASAAGSGTRYLTTDNNGDISAVAFPGITGSGNNNYHTKWTASGTLVNSMIQDNGTSASLNYPIQANSQFFVYRQQVTATGDGQSTIYGYRDRNSQNVGASYGQNGSNTGVTGMSFWGDDYSFGVGGWNYNDFSRTGGVVGGEIYGNYWGSLGYKAASTVTYGVYGSNAMGSGTGYLPSTEAIGIGGGFFGSMIGTISKGEIAGQLNSGELFASYNSGNTYTTGKNIELVKTGEASTPVYAVTSVDAKIYNNGTAELVNGEAYIAFDENYKALLGDKPVVTVTPNGDCNGVYIASVDKNGFRIKEMNNGNSTVNISWISVGNRIDNRMEEATRIVSASGFDRSIQQVLVSDSNLETTSDGIWWDGQTIRFGKIPAHLTTTKRPSTK
ncbi:hypothetical protein [Fluviicola taffensis]|uniref:hypothetical protein n=1 Tax=Fluviicola taffensis TaxID=191579 RepID=UPI003137D94B